MAPQPLVRRQPLLQRLSAYLDLSELGFWLAQTFNLDEWDQLSESWLCIIGLFLNIIFLTARSWSQQASILDEDDIFEDGPRLTSWTLWPARLVSYIFTIFCFSNALYTFSRERHYRMFELSETEAPKSKAARRVPVDSSPISASPLRTMSKLLLGQSPDAHHARTPKNVPMDVWEIGVWDPLPTCLRLFCLFSPGHVILYWVQIPSSDPYSSPYSSSTSSLTIFSCFTQAAILSAQLFFLTSKFLQRAQDEAIVKKEVLHEYDAKFVHPRTQIPTRDVGTQIITLENGLKSKSSFLVDLHTPTYTVKQGFYTQPSRPYAPYLDQTQNTESPYKRFSTPNQQVVDNESPLYGKRKSSPLKPTPLFPSRSTLRQTPAGRSGDGGSLGMYSHADSPLRRMGSPQRQAPNMSRR